MFTFQASKWGRQTIKHDHFIVVQRLGPNLSKKVNANNGQTKAQCKLKKKTNVYVTNGYVMNTW